MNPLGDLTRAMFALQQPIGLEEIASGLESGHWPMADAQTPNWFAAAATSGSSLLDMAPELQVLPADLDEADRVDVEGIDLVRIYAPELAGLEDDVPTSAPVVVAEPAPRPAAAPGASVQLGLLKELSDLDE